MEFKEHFARLNDEQKKAASYIEGPLLVIAGPGTGKTQLLSSRVAYILENTDTKAQNILCLTFTNKAALNMRERILSITEGKARDVYVHTFHSFASEIMNMYPDYFWSNARLSTAPDAVQQEIIQSILASLPLDNPLALKFAGKFTVASDVKQALKLTKEAGLTPEKLQALLEANIRYIDLIEQDLAAITAERLSYKTLEVLQKKVLSLPDQAIETVAVPLLPLSTVIKESLDYALPLDQETGKTGHTGDWKKQWIQTIDGTRAMHKERAKNAWWVHLAYVYDSYRRRLHRRGYYDYSDMLVEVLTQLEQHPDMRADIQERYLYVMIDEFQDTNAAQLRLAHLVADHYSNEGKPNIMAVGDDDQSIFKFNGAELNNLLNFRRSYPSAETIVLTDNYRSSQDILDVAGKIIAQAEDRLVYRDTTVAKNLYAKNPPPKGEIVHYSFRTAEEQFSAVSRHIKENYSSQSSTVVIARGHESLRSIAQHLVALNVPLHYEQQQNILEHPVVVQVWLLAEICLGIQNGDIASVNSVLSKSLPHPMWRIEPKILWSLALSNYHSPDWLASLESSQLPELNAYAILLLELAQISANESLVVTVEYLLGLRQTTSGTSPLGSYYASSQTSRDMNEYLHGLSAIRYLRSLASEFGANTVPTIEDFISFIRLEKDTGTVITDESPFVSGEHAVSLLTTHKAKGLEFDRVYIIDAIEKNWQPRKGGRKPPSNLPLQPAGDDLDDYIRLMFVATTRAKQDLVISSYCYDDQNNQVLPSPIISSIVPPVAYQHVIETVEILEQSLRWPRLSGSNEKMMLRSKLEDYHLSVTHLLNFLDVSDCGPEKFLEQNVLRLPSVKSSNLAHGTAVHAALEHAQKLVNSDSFNLADVQKIYKSNLEKEHLPPEELYRYTQHGHELLERLFKNDFLKLIKGSTPEQKITGVPIGQARLSGILDRIDLRDNELIISDYKTGQPLSSFTTSNRAQQVKAWKQRTQLIFYSLLLQNSPRFDTGNKVVSGQMIYLSADSAKDLSRTYRPTSEDIDRLSRLITVVWKKIMDVDLPNTTKYSRDYAGIQQFEEDLLND